MNRGEVWHVAFDPTIGQEIQKSRPAVIISSDAVGALALRVVVPFTSWQPEFAGASWLVRIEPSPQNGLARSSAGDAFQVKSLSIKRLTRKLGELSLQELQAVVRAVAWSLAIREHAYVTQCDPSQHHAVPDPRRFCDLFRVVSAVPSEVDQ